MNKFNSTGQAEMLSDEQSEEFIGRSGLEKVFSCFVAAGGFSLVAFFSPLKRKYGKKVYHNYKKE